MTKNDCLGIALYFSIAFVFGASVAILMLFIKENSDRCHYYNGVWNKADLIRGSASIALAIGCRLLIFLA